MEEVINQIREITEDFTLEQFIQLRASIEETIFLIRRNEIKKMLSNEGLGIRCINSRGLGLYENFGRIRGNNGEIIQTMVITFRTDDTEIEITLQRSIGNIRNHLSNEMKVKGRRFDRDWVVENFSCPWLFPQQESSEEEKEVDIENLKEKLGYLYQDVKNCLDIIYENKRNLPFEVL